MLPRDKRVEKIDLAYVSLCGDVIAMRDGIALLLCCACSVGGCTRERQGATQLSAKSLRRKLAVTVSIETEFWTVQLQY